MRRHLGKIVGRAAAPLFVALVAAAAIAVQAPGGTAAVDLPETQPVLGVQGQVHYLPFDGPNFLAILRGEEGSDLPSANGTVTSPVRLIASMVSALDDNEVYVDHWEDGYDADPIAAPGSSTQHYTLDEGQVQVLDNWVDTSLVGQMNPGGIGHPYWDGGDRIVSTGALVITAGGWPTGAQTLHANAAVVPDVDAFGLDFVAPVGQDTYSPAPSVDRSMWEYTGFLVLAAEDNTHVTADGASFDLDAGQSHLVNGGVQMGDSVHADKPVLVYLATGEQQPSSASSYEGRMYRLTPTERWSDAYMTPVGGKDTNSNSTRVFLYNPSNSDISVTATVSGGATSSITVPAHAQASHKLPTDGGATYTSPGHPFYALQAITTPEGSSDNSATYNWGLALTPMESLTPMVVVGYGPGSDDTGTPGVDANDSGVYVSSVSNTTLYVDLDGNRTTGGSTDPNGNKYDFSCTLTANTPVVIKDVGSASTCSAISTYNRNGGSGGNPGDNDMTGARIYTTSGVSIAAAWGQIPGAATQASPAIDMGTTVLPFPTIDLDKSSQILNDDGDGEAVPGDTIRYTISVTNRGISPVDDLVVNDQVPANTTYVPGSTVANGNPITDPVTGTPFPLDEGGLLIPPVLAVGETRTVVYDLLVDDPLPDGVTEILNEITLESDYGVYTDTNIQPVSDPGSIGDRVWNDADGDGVQDGGETGLVGVTVELVNDSDVVVDSTTTGVNGAYTFDSVYPGTYKVRVVPGSLPASSAATYDLDGTGTPNTATVTLAAEQVRTDVDFGYVAATISLAKTVYAGHDNGNSCPGSELVSGENGDDVTYCFRVTNTGAVPLVGVTVDDPDLDTGIDQTDMSLESGNPATLAAGQSVVWSYDGHIDGDLVNTATATALLSVGGPSRTATDTAEVNEIGPGITIEKTVYRGHDGGTSCAGSVESVTARTGGAVTYCFKVTNTGETNLSAVTFSDADLGIAGGTQVHALLTPGQSHTFTVDATVDGDLTNTATATGTSPAGVQPTDTDTASVDEIHPAIGVENTIYAGHDAGASCQGGESLIRRLSQPVTWCFVVTNTGDVPLTNVTLDDAALGIDETGMTLLSGSLATMAPGATAVLYRNSTATVDVTNDVVATGQAPVGADVTDNDGASLNVIDPSITLDKTVYDGHDDGAGCEGGVSLAQEDGHPITWCFVIENTGDSPLTDVTLADADLGIDQTDLTILSGSLSTLAAGQQVVGYYETTIDGPLVNDATVTGAPQTGADVTDGGQASVSVLDPGVDIQKTVYAGHDGGASCDGGEEVVGRAGDPITWCFAVENTGDTDLTVTVDDPDVDFSDSVSLDPGETQTLFHEGTIDGDLANTATATGETPDGHEVPDTDDASVDEIHPAIGVENTIYAGHDGGAGCQGGESLIRRLSQPVTWCFVVTNTGDVPLTNVTLDDLPLGVDESDLTLLSGSLATMAPGATTVLYLETTATADVDNDVTATGDAPVGPDVTDTDGADLDVIDPSIALDKSVYDGHDDGAGCPGGASLAQEDGHPITWCFVIENTGDSPLTNVTLSDADLGIDESDLTILSGSLSTLAAGQQVVGYYETAIDGALVNDATATATPQTGSDVSDDGQASVSVLDPGVDIQKTVYAGHDDGASCDGGELVTGQAGDPITWCFTVENTGDTDLVVTVEDDEIDYSDSVSLDPGETQTLYYEGTIDGDLVPNTATATGETPDDHEVPDTDTAAVDEIHPELSVDKTVYLGHDAGAGCEGDEAADAEVDQDITWCFALTNDGDVDLTDLTLDDVVLGNIDESDVTVLSGDLDLLAAGDTLVAYYEDTADVAMANTVTVGGTAPDDTTVSATDTASVDIVGPQIGLAKTIIDGPTANGDGSYALTYRLRVQNAGETRLDDVQVADDLALTFQLASDYRVDEVTSTGLTVDPAFDGSSDGRRELLTGHDTLGIGEVEDIFVTVTVWPGAFLGPYRNLASTSAVSPNGVNVNDLSDSGSVADPTDPNPGEPGDTSGTDDPVPVSFPPVDLTVVKSVEDMPDEGATSGTIDWGIVVSNQGAGDDPGPITVTDQLQDGLEFVSASGDGWECAHEGSTVTCVWGAPLAAGQSTTMIHVLTDVEVHDEDVSFMNGAHVASTGGETRTDNNDSAAQVDADFIPAPSSPSGSLPRTGATVGGLVLLGLALILGGRQLQRRSRGVAA